MADEIDPTYCGVWNDFATRVYMGTSQIVLEDLAMGERTTYTVNSVQQLTVGADTYDEVQTTNQVTGDPACFTLKKQDGSPPELQWQVFEDGCPPEWPEAYWETPYEVAAPLGLCCPTAKNVQPLEIDSDFCGLWRAPMLPNFWVDFRARHLYVNTTDNPPNDMIPVSMKGFLQTVQLVQGSAVTYTQMQVNMCSQIYCFWVRPGENSLRLVGTNPVAGPDCPTVEPNANDQWTRIDRCLNYLDGAAAASLSAAAALTAAVLAALW